VKTPRRIRWLAVTAVILGLIIVPFLLFGPRLEAWAAAVAEALAARPALAGMVIAGLLAADIVLPLPSSILGVTAGALLGAAQGALWSWAGMTVGCAVGYGLGRFPGREGIGRWIGTAEVRRIEPLAARYGDWMLITTRAIPVLAEASTIFAGLAEFRPARFFALVSLSNFAISAVYAWVGSRAVDTPSFLLVVLASCLLPLAAMVAFRRVGLAPSAASGPSLQLEIDT
jgi:uncharacterized membrane protein YdjX (TVP38/TMEM64 family)